jgi:hypothetical protein
MMQTIRRNNFTRFPNAPRAALAGLGLLALSGCAAPAIGALTIGEVLTVAGISSSIMTGRDLGEHALSALTGKDCRFLEAALREGRSFCEERGSMATRGDFGGVIALLRNKDGEVEETTIAAADLDPMLLGFAPVDRRAARDFSLEIARETSRAEPKQMIAFGMMSATFGQSWNYRLDMAPDASAQKFADASSATNKPATGLGLRPSRSPDTGR